MLNHVSPILLALLDEFGFLRFINFFFKSLGRLTFGNNWLDWVKKSSTMTNNCSPPHSSVQPFPQGGASEHSPPPSRSFHPQSSTSQVLGGCPAGLNE